jgi:hypothetical protein
VPAAALLLTGCASAPATDSAQEVQVDLGGSQEVPPVDAPGSANGSIKVTADGAISGSITTTDVAGVAAHVHMGAVGKNGPVIVPLKKAGKDTWRVPEGAKLNADQMAAYKAGLLYVNIHTAAHKSGEVRGQIIP